MAWLYFKANKGQRKIVLITYSGKRKIFNLGGNFGLKSTFVIICLSFIGKNGKKSL